VRELYPPSDERKSEGGLDVVAVKRAVSRAGFWPWRAFDDDYNEAFSKAVATFQRRHKIQPTGFYGKPTHTALVKSKAEDHPGEFAFDATAIALLEREEKLRSKSDEQTIAEKLEDYCALWDGPYVWGGGHDGTPLNDSPHIGADCSGSTSDVLAKFGLLGSSTQHVAEWFKSWGDHGPGRYVTVHAANDHVWIEFTIPDREWARFDTSPHGDGEHGPRLRHRQRDETRFVSRHPRGY
jgi:hypothetical protein